MPYQPNTPNYQTGASRVKSFKDFEQQKTEEVEELKQMNRNFTKRGEKHQIPGERKHKFNRVTRKIDDISHDEVLDKIESIEEDHEHLQNYMFFNSMKTIHRLSSEILKMDPMMLDQMISKHNWALEHVATSKDDIEEVFNWIASHK